MTQCYTVSGNTVLILAAQKEKHMMPVEIKCTSEILVKFLLRYFKDFALLMPQVMLFRIELIYLELFSIRQSCKNVHLEKIFPLKELTWI